ncbi:hypothetical protein B0H16DRAFT_1729853 [Mycena metata]|uniref:Uncharacterized protein n=1 Tax=Mycena metata TaxID=1033252 RepID=A0AAD7IAE5_9AGAR|nr:hypothetical protein B0H16DRAFT_1729853 [Mycena metata]
MSLRTPRLGGASSLAPAVIRGAFGPHQQGPPPPTRYDLVVVLLTDNLRVDTGAHRRQHERARRRIVCGNLSAEDNGGRAALRIAPQRHSLRLSPTAADADGSAVGAEGNRNARAPDEEMDAHANVDGEALNAQSAHSLAGGPPVVPPPPPHLQPSPSPLAAGTSPSTDFAPLTLLSPHPGAGVPRPA